MSLYNFSCKLPYTNFYCNLLENFGDRPTWILRRDLTHNTCTSETNAQLIIPLFTSIAASALKMETKYSEVLAFTNESTRHQCPEEYHHPHRRGNLKYHSK